MKSVGFMGVYERRRGFWGYVLLTSSGGAIKDRGDDSGSSAPRPPGWDIGAAVVCSFSRRHIPRDALMASGSRAILIYKREFPPTS